MATIKSTLSLQDKFTPTLSKVEKEARRQAQTFRDMSKEVDNYKNSLNSADSMMKRLLTWTGIILGVKKLMDFSDTYTQTHARLDMITNDVENLENRIYRSAQNARVSYQSVADTVSKLGMQAGEAFNNNANEVLAFSELLNKTFTFSGLDTNAIDSVMYNITQSLSSGRLLGQDYRILKQNAPQILQYLRQFYGNISQAQLDALVTAGKVSAQDLKNAMFQASDDINNKFKKMPVTFQQVWTKLKNTVLKALQPVLRILSTLADWLDKIVTFLDTHKYILYIITAAIAALTIEYIALNASLIMAKIAQWALNSAMLACPVTWIILAIAVLIGVLIYLWNTNDDVAYGILWAWDRIKVGISHATMNIRLLWEMLKAGGYNLLGAMQTVGAAFLTVWYGLKTGIKTIILGIITIFQGLVNAFIDGLDVMISAANKIPGVDIESVNKVTWAEDYANDMSADIANEGAQIDALNAKASESMAKAAQIASDAWTNYSNEAYQATQELAELDRTRDERVANRKKLTPESILEDLTGSFGLDDVIGTDSTGGKAIKTTTNDNLLSDEDIQLLLDVATRDYKLNYQQVTPNITLTFGDVRETADVDDILDKVADKLEEIYEGNLEVSTT